MNKRPRWTKIISVVFFTILCALLIINFQTVSDHISTAFYRPTAAVSEVETKLNLTGRAQIIFAASNPQLETSDSFNAHCHSDDANTTILGCYSNRKIYVYNIEAAELSGIVESTMAHEFLHAAWERLSEDERTTLRPYLLQVYEENQTLLEKVMSAYDESEYLEELYTRCGTQIADLPEQLESHYAKYFADQDAVVAYYDSYIATFNDLSAQLDALAAEMDALGASITAATASYNERSASFGAAVEEFNNCAATVNCFNSYTFTTEHNRLVAEQNSLNALYAQLDADISRYNQLVSDYNSNLLHSQNLQNLINSNSKVEQI